jgi:E3 ubiquitin-protein ligase DOA10
MFDNNTPTLQDLPQVPEGYNVEDTTATQEQPEQVEETEQVVTPEQPPQETSEERNFRNLRMKADRLEKERNEALQRLRSYESQQAPEEEFDLKPNDLAEGKHLNKVQNKIQSLEHQLIETRLRSQYPDIDSVVSQDNLAILQRDYPEVANTIGASKNLYSKAVSAYTILKKLGIHTDVSPYAQEKALAHRNAAKPKPLASVSPQQGDSPLSNANAFANGLTDDLKRKLHQEMIAAMRNKQ